MGYIQTHPATQDTPAESRIGSPISCAGCGQVWDRDDDDQTNTHHRFHTIGFAELDGDPYCVKDCYAAAKGALYRAEAADILLGKLMEAAKEIARLDRRYPEAEEAPDSPLCIIDDLKERLPRYAEGKDSGWRNGLMLDYDEAMRLRLVLERVILKQVGTLRQTLNLIPYKVRANEYVAADTAVCAFRLGLQLDSLSQLCDRTEKGQAA